jgi:hypothetical protein
LREILSSSSRCRLPSFSAAPCGRDGNSRQPVETFRKLQNRFSCTGIGQLRRYLSGLFRAVQPFQGFIQIFRHVIRLPLLLEDAALLAAAAPLEARYGH